MSIGNTKDQGNKSNNFPYQLRTLQLLGAINSSVSLGATEATLQLVLSAIQDGQDYEAKLIQDANGDTFLEVRIWNPDTQTWETPLYYKAGDNTPYTIGSPGGPVAPIVYINPSSILAQIKAVLDNIYLDTTSLAAEDFATETTLSGIKTQTDLLSFDAIGLNIRALDCAVDEVAICTDGNPVGAANPLPITGTVTTIPSGTQDVNILSSSIILDVQATDLDIRDLAFATDKVDVSGSSVTVTAIDLDIRDLSHLQDSVKIGDGSDFLDINTDGSLNTNLRDGSGTPITSTGGALDVNILSGVTLDVNLSYLNDTVQIYGSDTTLPIATDASGNLQIDVLSQPALTFATDTVDVSGSSVSISNFPVTQDVNIVSAVTLDVSGSNVNAVVTATDLDIRNLTFVDDKVDVSGSSVKLQDGLGNNITSTTGALDVNIASGVTLEVNLDQTNDQVQVYGSDLTAPVATDTSGHLQVDILTIPEVEIKNDAGNPIPVSGTVTVNQPVAVTDNGGSLTVDATDLDIRDLTFASDKVDVSNSINVEVVQAVHDDLNVNANIQVGNVDVSNSNPVPISDAGGSITVDGTVALDTATLTALENITVQNGGGASAVNIQDGGNSITVDGIVAATQSGTWNITNITGTVSLPTGAATETTLSTISGTASSILAGLAALNQEATQLLIKAKTDNLDVLLSTRASETTVASIDTRLTPQVRTHNTISTTTSGTVSAGSIRGSVINAGNAAGIWNGISLPAGVSIPWDAVGNRDTYGAISYDATGTTFIIEYTT